MSKEQMKRKHISRKLLGLLTAVAVMSTCLLSGCSQKASEEKPEASQKAPVETQTAEKTDDGDDSLPVLRVAVQPYLLAVPNYYMVENGIDKENGFKIEMSVYENGTLINEALGADLWDIGTGGTSAVFGIANFGAKVIADIDLCTGGAAAYVRADSPIAKVKGELGENLYGNTDTLKGAQVLVPIGTLNQYNVMMWAEAAGLNAEDLEFVHMDNSSAFQAFKAGQGDIMACSPPLTYSCDQEGWVAAASCTDLGLMCYDPLLANPNTLAEKEEIICKYVKAMYETFDLFAKDPELAAEWSVKWQAYNGNQTTIEDARKEVSARPFITSDHVKDNPVGESIYKVAEFFNSVGTMEDADLAKVKPNLTNEIIDKVFK